jgi:hypothetical protein
LQKKFEANILPRSTLLLLLLGLDGTSLLLLSELDLTLGNLAPVPSLGAGLTEGLVCTVTLHVTTDLGGSESVRNSSLRNGHDITERCLGGGLGLIGRGIALLRLAVLFAGEDDKLSLVSLKPLYVGLEALYREVSAAVVERDANARGFLPENTSFLKLFGGETTAGAYLVLVPASLAVNNGPEKADGAGGESGGLGLALQAACLLLGRLLEVDSTTRERKLLLLLLTMDRKRNENYLRPETVGHHTVDSRPRLVVVLVRQDIVVLRHLRSKINPSGLLLAINPKEKTVFAGHQYLIGFRWPMRAAHRVSGPKRV